MQFTNEDSARYVRLLKKSCQNGQASLADLSTYVKDEVAIHCAGSGYRIEQIGMSNSVSLSGAHRTLGHCLWSDKTVSSSSVSRSGGRGRGVKRSRSGARIFDNGRSYFGSASGLSRGKDVHEEIGRFIMWDTPRFRAAYPTVDPMTKAVLLHLKGLGFRGAHAEYIVYTKAMGVGTAVDLVCLDRQGNLVFVELKTGYHDVFTKHKATMQPPFHHIPDSALNRARSQLLLAIALYASNHAIVPHGRVVHVDQAYRVVSFDMGPLAASQANIEALRGIVVGRPIPPKMGEDKKKKTKKG